MAPVPDADHDPRLLAGGSLRRARAPRRRRARRLVARARRRDHARLRVGRRPPVRDVRPRADGRRHLRGDHLRPARELRAPHARPHARARSSAPRGARRQGPERRAPAAHARRDARRDRLLVRRRDLADAGRHPDPATRLARRPRRRARRPPRRRADRERRRRERRAARRARRAGAPARRAGTRRSDDRGDPHAARRVRPGPGGPALRAAPARLRRRRLGDEAPVRSRRLVGRLHRRPADLAAHRSSRSSSTRAGPSSIATAGSGSASASSG